MTTYPIAYVGQPVTADFWNSGQWNYVTKAAGTGITSDATINDDPDLSGISLAVGVYHVEFELLAQTAAGTATIDLDVAWEFSGTASGTRMCLGPAEASTSRSDTNMTVVGASLATEVRYGLASTATASIRESCILTVTVAGVLDIKWAQGTSTAELTTVSAGSFLRYKQIG